MVDVQDGLPPATLPTAIAELEHGLTAQCIKNVSAGLAGPLAMGVGVGVLAGLFFGTWAAFVSYGPRFDDETRAPRA